jgi:hypothetical protein
MYVNNVCQRGPSVHLVRLFGRKRGNVQQGLAFQFCLRKIKLCIRVLPHYVHSPKILTPLLPKICQPVKDGQPKNEKKSRRKGEHARK